MPCHILIGCSGSVASIKIPQLVTNLMEAIPDIAVQLVCTDKALHFFDKSSLTVPVHTDADEWNTWKSREDPILHIELRKWADMFLIAPLDANTMAKIASGICDNLLTCVVRAWDMDKPLLFAPAMNTHMWQHPLTRSHLETLKGLGYTEVPCVSKKLACGDEGLGAMAEVSTLVSNVEDTRKSLLQGARTCKTIYRPA